MSQSALDPTCNFTTHLITTIIDGGPRGITPVSAMPSALTTKLRHARIKRHPVLNSVVSVTRQLDRTTNNTTCCCPLDKLNGWLWGVSVNQVRGVARN